MIDVIAVLTDSSYPNRYWSDLKRKLIAEGATQLYEKIVRLKMRAPDGKLRDTDGADTETTLRITQSVPSPKAEPIKQWLAREGAKRLEVQAHPIDPVDARDARGRLTMPAWDAPAMEWVDYHEQMASLYRRQYAFAAQLRMAQDDIKEHGERLDEHGERLEAHGEWLDEHAQRLEGHDTRLEDHDAQLGDVRSRMERLEEGQRQLPDLLLRMGPQTLTPSHQAQVKAWAVRLHDLGGFAFPTIYGELNTHFHVGKYSDIADAEWEAVAAWFRVRLDAAEKRHNA